MLTRHNIRTGVKIVQAFGGSEDVAAYMVGEMGLSEEFARKSVAS